MPEEPVKRLPFFELVRKTQAGELSYEEMNRYFVRDAETSTAFNPKFRINYKTIDVTGAENLAAAAGHNLALDGVARLGAPAGALPPDGSYVAEGDSWFRLPIIYPPTMIDFAATAFPINNVAHWGDTLDDMVTKAEYLKILKDRKTKVLMFSGGGNDVLGQNLVDCINLLDPRFTKPEDAAFYPKRLFYTQLDAVDRLFQTIVQQVARTSPTTTLLVHGYDYARPIENGVFLGKHFARQGIDPRGYAELCRAIVRYMIDQFNTRLRTLAENHELVNYLDLRGTVKQGQWIDELHALSPGARALSNKLKARLRALKASPPIA
jgi:hypothetical protein